MVATHASDAAGNLVGRTLANGVVEERTYDSAGRMTEVTHSSPLGVLARFTYTYDAVANPLSVTSLTDTEVYTYRPSAAGS